MNKQLIEEETEEQYKILLEGYTCVSLKFDGGIELQFQQTAEDEWKTQLRLNGPYSVRMEDNTTTYQVEDPQGFHQLLGLWQNEIASVKATKEGVLYLATENGIRLEVDDNAYKNWEFLVYKKQSKLQIASHLISGTDRMVMI